MFSKALSMYACSADVKKLPSTFWNRPRHLSMNGWGMNPRPQVGDCNELPVFRLAQPTFAGEVGNERECHRPGWWMRLVSSFWRTFLVSSLFPVESWADVTRRLWRKDIRLEIVYVPTGSQMHNKPTPCSCMNLKGLQYHTSLLINTGSEFGQLCQCSALLSVWSISSHRSGLKI